MQPYVRSNPRILSPFLNTVETVVLLNNKKVDGYIDIELNL